MADGGDEHPLIADLLSGYAGTKKGRKRVLGILRMAAELFSASGYEGMTLREVARQSGVTLSNVQHYFPSRDDLLRAMLTHEMLGYDVSYDRIAGEPACLGIDRLRRVCRFLLDDTRNERSRGIFFELWSLSHRNPIAAEIKKTLYDHHIDVLARIISEAVPGCAATREKAVLVAAQIEGMMVVAAPGHPVDAAEEMFLSSLGALVS